MVVSWFGRSDISELIARKKYSKAAAAIREQLRQGSLDPRLRMQLGDVLIMAGRSAEAVPVLTGVADELASQGEAAKAIALLKKIQRADPGSSHVESRLAKLIKGKNKPRAKAVGYAPREGLDAAGYEPAGVVFAAEELEAGAMPSEEERIEAARGASWVPSTHQEEPAELPLIQLPPEPEVEAGEEAPSEVIETPLFKGFSQEELVAVMQGLKLLTCEPGDIVITEGDVGDSLFILTKGTVKTFVKNPGGAGQRQVRTMSDGAFFGEISILSGKPRTATVTAATPCELLELDRATLDGITRTHPHVHQVLEEFYIARATTQDAPVAD